MCSGETEIQMVQRHVAAGEEHVQKQLRLIERLTLDGVDTGMAQTLLATFRQTLAEHRAHLARIS